MTASLLANPAKAQEAPAGDSTAEADGGIVVTARRREETLQDVPVAINVLSQSAIEQRGIANVTAVASLTPGLQFDTGASPADVRPSLRGIALVEGRSNVAIIIDGIDATGVSLNTTIGGGGAQTAAALMDLQRIEVVKGPQTVYFGRSAFAGAIQFISKDPEFKPGATMNFAMGTYGQQELTAHVTGPIIGDTVAAKLSATYRDFQGFYQNPGNGQGLDADRTWGVGGSILIRSGGFTGKIRANYINDNAGPGAGFILPRADTSLYGVNRITADNFDESQVAISSDHVYAGNDSKTYRGVLDLKYDLGGGFTINSLSGYNRIKSHIEFDFDKKAANVPSGTNLGNGFVNCLPGTCVGIFDFDTDLEQISTDLRLSYDSGPLRAMIGGYYFDENYQELDYTRFLGARPFITSTRENIPVRPARLFTNTYSGFGSLEYELGALTLSSELRYNHEIIRAEAATGVNILFLTGSNAISFRGKTSFDSWLPRASVRFKVSPDLNVYASAAKGSKPGGFNTGQVRDDLRPFGQETIWTYEIGAKGSAMNGALSFEAGAYYSDWSNVQVTTICYGSASVFGPEAQCPSSSAVSLNYIINAKKARVKGFELSATAKPTDWFTLTGSYTYTDSKFTDFVARDVFPAPAGTTRQFGGNRVPLIPKHSLVTTAKVDVPLNDALDGFVEMTGKYRSARYARFDNRVLLNHKFTADAQIGVKGDSWTALVFVSNIFNDMTPDFSRYYGNFNPSRTNGEYIGAPAKRTGGVRFIKNF
ncbi:TonB-dependent receptor [Novosphingobium sp. KCTC 2891]|uniref:TonB-dependent receptor n=1 Tax=Novosphingobium sp. KCTC 2891 TaxID=2989730 RepID=UPI0022215F3D|nr:TonB-dependent receptor [Novosphingobium sp. KCTC 2891]MCW1383805.1 TonB-dependent receptor [Novosphingobium sp. KCTC 2891]